MLKGSEVKLYRYFKRWVSELEATELLQAWAKQYGHICNQVSDPGSCCPTAHGAGPEACTCTNIDMLRSVELLTIDGVAAIMIENGIVRDQMSASPWTTPLE